MIQAIKEFFWGKPKLITYTVTECKKMPSAVGMTTQGVNDKSFTISSGDSYRTINPTELIPTENGFLVKTKKLELRLESLA